jgi:hypothetical protein
MPAMTRSSLLCLALLPTLACASAAATPSAAPTPPVGVSAPPTAPPAAPLPLAEPDSATEVLMRNRAPFDACYALAKKTRPDIGRTNVQITFEMDDYGKLLNVSFIYRNKMDDSAKDCMRTAAEALKFPSSLRGTQTGTIMFNP